MYHSKPAYDLAPFLRFLELRRSGSWRDFDAALKSVVPGISDSYSVADRLAAYAFVEFAWEDRSWEFSPTVLVEMPTVHDSSPQASRMARQWLLVGASHQAAEHICKVLQ